MSVKFLRFAAVGIVGFAADAGALAALIWLTQGSPYLLRVGSFLAAATVTWWLNRRVTFSDTLSRSPLRQWSRFLAANSAGALVNYAVFAAMVGAAWPPIAGVAAGSLSGLLFNFHFSRRFVFLR
jgi:putative flippase GtrA